MIIETMTGQTNFGYVTEHILQRASMADSGFSALDQLPALAFVDLENGIWRANTFELPIIGASDGGLFATAPGMGRF